MRVTFFEKWLKLNLDFKNAAKIEEKCLAYEIIASELVSLNCLYEEQDTFHRQPMC